MCDEYTGMHTPCSEHQSSSATSQTYLSKPFVAKNAVCLLRLSQRLVCCRCAPAVVIAEAHMIPSCIVESPQRDARRHTHAHRTSTHWSVQYARGHRYTACQVPCEYAGQEIILPFTPACWRRCVLHGFVSVFGPPATRCQKGHTCTHTHTHTVHT